MLLYRRARDRWEVLLAHPGGPLWARKDEGAWSIPKGELEADEDPLKGAVREFREETGQEVSGTFLPLTPVRQPSGKLVHAWAVEGDFNPHDLRGNSFSLEWPPKSGRMASFPEIDRAAWFDLPVARTKVLKGQLSFLDEFERLVTGRSASR